MATNVLKAYDIPFTGLSLEVHQFDYLVEDAFFEALEYSEIRQGTVKAHIELEKQETMLVLNFTFSGQVQLPCDRCLDPLEIPVSGEERLIVKFGESWEEESEEVLVIPQSEYKINVAQYLYEYISLALPVQRLHGDKEDGTSGCNPEVLKKLESHREEEQSDPRWDALKNLKFDK